MKTHLKYLLGLVFMVFVFGGCQDPSRIEIPDGATVEFVLGTNPQVSQNKTYDDRTFYIKFSRYLLCLNSDQNQNNSYEYPEGYEDQYSWPKSEDIKTDDFKKLCEDEFKKAFGTKYYKEGTTINLTKWTSKAEDLVTTGYYSQLYFLAEDVGKNYDGIKSLETIEVHNENITIYVYWNYDLLNNN